MIQRALTFALMAGPGLCALASAETLLIRAGRVLDVAQGRYLDAQAILIDGDKIKEVGSWDRVSAGAPPDATRIDLSGLTVLPGLIDCHAHLLAAVEPRLRLKENMLSMVAGLSASSRALLGAANAREALEAGITTVRNVGHSGVDGDAALRDAIEKGWVVGPRMLAATRKLTPPGGQAFSARPEVAREILELEFLPVNGPEAGRGAVRQALSDGADFIKVVMDVEPRSLAPDEIGAIVAEAHRSGVKVAAHATTAAGTKAAADAGVDSIEHADEASDETFRMMAQKRIFLGATDWSVEMLRDLYMRWQVLAPPVQSAYEQEAQKWVEKCRKRMERARKAGVRFVMASDMWFRYPGKTRGQATLLVLDGLQEEGVPAGEILKAATVNAAELIGWSDRVGAIEAGRRADLIALEGDPLADIKALRNVVYVMKGGAVSRDARSSKR